MRLIRILALAMTVIPMAALAKEKVIVLGFDGVDARYTEQWMNEGKLPNLAKLRAQGTFRPLRPTIPAQTPVSWSTFSTGIDPGRTGIFDFLRRDPKTYLPVFAAFDETKEKFLFGEHNPLVAALIPLLLLGIPGVILRRRFIGMVLGVLAVVLTAATFLVVLHFIPFTRPGVINRRQGI